MGRDMWERYRIDVQVVYDKGNITRQFSKAINDEQILEKTRTSKNGNTAVWASQFVSEIIINGPKRGLSLQGCI